MKFPWKPDYTEVLIKFDATLNMGGESYGQRLSTFYFVSTWKIYRNKYNFVILINLPGKKKKNEFHGKLVFRSLMNPWKDVVSY